MGEERGKHRQPTPSPKPPDREYDNAQHDAVKRTPVHDKRLQKNVHVGYNGGQEDQWERDPPTTKPRRREGREEA
ncbi:MAG: hypothetical protein WC941_08480 [Candidatus Bathyarchaeia archaeon]